MSSGIQQNHGPGRSRAHRLAAAIEARRPPPATGAVGQLAQGNTGDPGRDIWLGLAQRRDASSRSRPTPGQQHEGCGLAQGAGTGEVGSNGRHVGHVGRRTLKWAWIEAAHGAVRKGGRFREIFDRRTDGGKRDRNRGYIAVAHELCRIAYVLWKKEVDYNPARPARPGSQKKSKKKTMKKTKSQRSRPGKGQPDRPMVVAAV